MDSIESSAPHAHPSTEDHDDTVEAHYASLERLRPHACLNGVVYIGHLVEDPGTGEEVEVVEAIPCRRCAGDVHQRRVHTMCQKRQRRCAVLLQIREEALEEWTRAETYSDVCRAWGRLGGRVTLHRYGCRHFAELAKASRRRS